MILEDSLKKYNSFSKIRETKKYYFIHTKIPYGVKVENIPKFKILKVKKETYKITISYIHFGVFPSFIKSIKFKETPTLFNKRTEFAAMNTLNDFFEYYDSILEEFI